MPTAAAQSARGGTYNYIDQVSWHGYAQERPPSREEFRLVVEPRKGDLQRVAKWEQGPTEPSHVETFRWTPAELLLLRHETGSVSGYDYQPPVVELKFPLRDGASWSGKTRARSDTLTYHTEIKSHSVQDVPGYGRLRVWRVVVTASMDVQGFPGLTRVTYVEDTNFAPELFVPVKQVTINKDYNGSELLGEERSTRTLQPPP